MIQGSYGFIFESMDREHRSNRYSIVGLPCNKDYPDIAFDTFIIDDFCCRMIAQPEHFDVAVMPNLYGDDDAYFESAHGTAPDIAGRKRHTATLLSGCLMLDYLGFDAAAQQLRRATAAVYDDGMALAPDQGGNVATTDLCAAVHAHLGHPGA